MTKSSKNTIVVEPAKSESDLNSVKSIYSEHKRVLGFMPDGGFRERLAKNQVIVAKVDSVIAGYVLFSLNLSREVRIAHLAVSGSFQLRGLSKHLVDYLVKQYSDKSRIRLNCRADYEASEIWQRLGFIAARRKPGRKAGGSELIVYHYSLDANPLFTLVETTENLPLVVCDANVCIDMRYEARPRHENSSGLLADWLSDEIRLSVTEEIFNDLNRQPEPLRSEMLTEIRTKWEIVETESTSVEVFLRSIRSIMGNPKDPSSASDQRHLAIAAAKKAAAFATHDEELLLNSADILANTGLRVQKPADIISEIDSVVRSSLYEYRELKNTGIERLRVRSSNELEVEELVSNQLGEKHSAFIAYIDAALSNPDRFDVHQIRDSQKRSLALVVTERHSEIVHVLRRIRFARRLRGTRLGNVIMEHLAYQPIGEWSDSGPRLVHLEDPNADDNFFQACLRRGFIHEHNQTWRISLPGIWNSEGLKKQLEAFVEGQSLPVEIAKKALKLLVDCHGTDETTAQRIEQLIHPGKVNFVSVPCYIIPIQPKWVQELFDFRVWRYQLLEMDTLLALNPDSVYYKKPRNSPTSKVARILWYVSGDASKGGNCIRACSAMTKGVNGTVKDLFREYKRLGVFEWQHLIEHFGSADASAFAIEFTNTELLPNPIRLAEIDQILVRNGMKKQPFASAVRINQAAYEEIYTRSKNKG